MVDVILIALIIAGPVFLMYREGLLGGAPQLRKDEALDRWWHEAPRHLNQIGSDDEGRRG